MISRKQAVTLCETHFPRGPEKLAEGLGVSVRQEHLKGCDGWYVRTPRMAIVRLNSRNSRSDIVSSRSGAYGEKSAGETEANRLAAEFLLPVDSVRQVVTSTPVDGAALQRLSRKANVSAVMAACRVASLARQLGLDNAAVLGFEKGEPRWRWSDTPTWTSHITGECARACERTPVPPSSNWL